MSLFPSSGRIDANWIAENPYVGESTFRLDSDSISNPNFRDAFIGNGSIGQRISPEGDAFCLSSSACLIHGLWNDSYLMNPPRWAILCYADGTERFSRQSGKHDQYLQSLHMDIGVLTTKSIWTSPANRKTEISSTFFLSRTHRNLGILRTAITPHFDGTVSFTDVLDGASLSCTELAFSERGEIMELGVRMGTKSRLLLEASRLECSDNISLGPEGMLNYGEDVPLTLSRTITFPVTHGSTYIVTKYVGIFSDADAEDPKAAAEYLVIACSYDEEIEAHKKAWLSLWRPGIQVGNLRVQKIINAALYQLYGCLSEDADVTWSVGPAGLTGNSWQGRVFWDADIWVFPVLSVLCPKLAAAIVKYRSKVLDGSRLNAKTDSVRGACMAWESAETGEERVPHPYEIIHEQRHINSDVVLAQWQYYLLSSDDNYFRKHGAEVILECCEYWASRVTYNAAKDRYEVLRVFCADEYAGVRDNNCSTNYGVMNTLRIGLKVCDLIGSKPPSQWADIIVKMWLPFDDVNQRYIEYDGYNGETIKQADTALMIYPYEMKMPDQIKRNVLEYYRSKYPPGKIMMSSSFDGIIDCETGDAESAWASFIDLLPHFRGPFLLCSESPDNEVISFITGLGGMLQLFMMGFAGLRIHEDGLMVEPTLPPQLASMKIKGANYSGTTFDIEFKDKEVHLSNFSRPPTFRVYRRDCSDIRIDKTSVGHDHS
mmetsp:Transcript_3944/g.6045  ORF Transcript_3944/g.6045 Transcript_3944/m.6045 type:complete len:714 (+) Transcript_3944:59-2200(+)